MYVGGALEESNIVILYDLDQRCDEEELYHSYVMCVCSYSIFLLLLVLSYRHVYDVYPMMHFKGLSVYRA